MAAFLGLCQALTGGLTGLLSFQCSLQLQAVHVFLHPPGVRVSTDLPLLPGYKPGKSEVQGLQSRRGKGTRGTRVMSLDHLPQTHKPSGTAEPAKAQGEIRVPWENLPCSDIHLPVQCRGEPGCSVECCVDWAHQFWKVLLAPDLLPMPYSQHRDSPRRPRTTHFSAEEGEGSHAAHGMWVAAPFPRG